MLSEFAYPVPHNPNSSGSECPVTRLVEPGVTFPNADPFGFEEVLFLGETAIREAFAILNDMTPAQAKKLVKATQENKELKERIRELEAQLAKWDAWQEKAEDLGLTVTLF